MFLKIQYNAPATTITISNSNNNSHKNILPRQGQCVYSLICIYFLGFSKVRNLSMFVGAAMRIYWIFLFFAFTCATPPLTHH